MYTLQFNKKINMQNNKNEKVVHTRVSKELFEKIANKAKKNRISTSNLLRNLVEDYLEIHSDVWDAIDMKLKNYLSLGEDSIIGYQSIILSKKIRCALCNKELNSGSQVFIGFFEKSPQKIIVCPNCKEK